jgi:hypothetical protein
MKVVSSPSGSHWYIVHKGIVVIGARKRGHGSATDRVGSRIGDG